MPFMTWSSNLKSPSKSAAGSFFVSWGPDGIPIRQKMLIASSKVELKNKLQGIFKELQASGIDEASEECMLELCRQGDRGAN
ncbi:hypothetical protein BOX15_Mlig031117g3 [Macrostomum lignano]|uniref:ADF-H domain-containing protein n=1 Tax=Macrostomum lignano TaxID=282301 RepID=A0A267GVM5_9PLAT|nr:hypothetical protein BOX15_Mlig031117g3 [Macrostomum lignano]